MKEKGNVTIKKKSYLTHLPTLFYLFTSIKVTSFLYVRMSIACDMTHIIGTQFQEDIYNIF